jgi:hypothetical protein
LTMTKVYEIAAAEKCFSPFFSLILNIKEQIICRTSSCLHFMFWQVQIVLQIVYKSLTFWIYRILLPLSSSCPLPQHCDIITNKQMVGLMPAFCSPRHTQYRWRACPHCAAFCACGGWTWEQRPIILYI